MRLSLIVALDRNGLIGDERGLPWRLPRDLRRFRDLTWGKPIIMGRTTHEHVGRPLPGRQNIVLSRQPGLQIAGCTVAHSLDEALDGAEGEVFVIGGRQIYREALPQVGRMYLTVVDGVFQGNAWFPSELVRPEEWTAVGREVCDADEKNAYRHVFLTVDRRRGAEPAFDLRRVLADPFGPAEA